MEYPAEFKKYVESLLRYCLTKTGHSEYELHLKFCDEPHELDKEEGSTTTAEMQANFTYLWVRVWVYPTVLEDWEEGHLRTVGMSMLHEVCHLFTNPLLRFNGYEVSRKEKDLYTEVLERQTQRIRNTMMRLLPENWYLPENLQEA